MARSGSYDFSLNRNEIINGAFRQIGVLGESQTASDTRIDQASQQLNLMIDEWAYNGMGLWLNKEIVMFLQKDQIRYRMGPNMISSYSDYACLISEYAKTEIATAASASDGTITVDSDDDFTNGDYIGIETDNGDIHWTTINGAPSGDVITLTSALDYAAGVDNHVYGFTNVVQRPIEIVDAFVRDESERDVECEYISLDEYRYLASKTSEGRPVSISADFQLDDIILHVWPEPDDMKDRIHLFVRYPIQDFDASTDDWDFPRGAGNMLKFNLAVQLAPEYGRAVSPILARNAERSLKLFMESDRELTSMKVKPNLRSYRGNY